MNRNLIAYYRVSTQRQGVSGLGLEAQQDAVRRYAEANGDQVVAEYTEIESGKISERPQLAAALDQAARDQAVLVVAKLDRLSRDAEFVLGLRRREGVEFVAVDMPHANRMMLGIMALVAEYEREQTSARTKVALAAAKARGVKLGGFRGDNGSNATARGRARAAAKHAAARARLEPLVRAALDFSEGNASAAAKILNETRVPTPSGRGAWHARQVGTYLKD